MKKIHTIVFVLITLLLTAHHGVYAATPVETPAVGVATKSAGVDVQTTAAETNSAEPVVYTLPYPGILPDHPLYMLKKFRDSILEILITDPKRKVEFYILQSDKEISAADFLSNKGKHLQVVDSVARAIAFKQKAISLSKDIKSQGKEFPGFLIEKITNSIQKQQDMQMELEGKADAETKPKFVPFAESIVSIKTSLDALK